MNEIDDVLSESMRRRAAEARLGGSSMADVQHRVVRRRRKLATITCAGLAVPALLGIGIVIGRDASPSSGVVSAGANAGDTKLPATSKFLGATCDVLARPTVDTGPVTTLDASQQISVQCVTVGSAVGANVCGYTIVSSSVVTLVPREPPSEFSTTSVDARPAYESPPSCPAPPECARFSAYTGTVSILGSSGGVPADQPTVVAGSVPPDAPTTTWPADQPTVAGGSVPPDVPTSTWPAVVDFSSGCANAAPTTWRCQDELTAEQEHDVAVVRREFATCEPMFNGGPPTSMEVTATTSVNYPATTTVAPSTTVEPSTVEHNIAPTPTSTIPVDPPVRATP